MTPIKPKSVVVDAEVTAIPAIVPTSPTPSSVENVGAAPAQVAKAPKKLHPVYGTMVDPTTGVIYGNNPLADCPETVKVGSWLYCQIKTGKLKIV